MIITLAVRALQILFAGVVLALSAVLIHGYGPGHAPSLIDYGAFCGAAGILFAGIGILACFVESLQGIIMLALDGIATFFVLAGGIAFAATMKVGNCGNILYLADHTKTIDPSDKKVYPGVGSNVNKYKQAVLNDVTGRCREVQASTAFLWFLFACFAVTVGLSFTSKSKGRGSMV